MVAPKSTTWTLEPHTRAKHEILKRYLQAWMPILSRGGFPEILYIDGFAGPGVYDQGEDGSPVIALKTALNYKPPLKAKLHFLFVEKEEDRAEILSSICNAMELPSNIEVSIEGSTTFEEAFHQHYTRFITKLGKLPPTFAFVDPFGWKGVPFEIITRVMAHPSCEVFVNFIYEELNRFLSHEDQISNFDVYFGSRDWNECCTLSDPRQRNRCLHDLYMRQLQYKAGVAYVRSFEMRNALNLTDYYLFYGTNSLLGLQKMKEAMWKVDESGEFSFSDATDPNQMVLFEKQPNFGFLRRQIIDAFGGKETARGAVEKFVLAETAFRETHYRKQVLKPLEDEGLLEVINPPTNRRPGTFGPDDLQLRFAPPTA